MILEESKPGVYMIRCRANGRIYIGASKSMYGRLKEHFSLLNYSRHPNKLLQSDYNSFGGSNFDRAYVEYCNESDIFVREVFYIDYYKSNDKDFGYNVFSGGLKRSDEDREILRNIKQSICKPVYGFNNDGDLIKTWPSIKMCAAELGVNSCDIRRTISLKQRYCKGYVLNSEPFFRKRVSKRGSHLAELNKNHPRYNK